MLYKLCSNGRAILNNREFEILDDKLTLSIVEDDAMYTAIITSGDKTYYRPFVEGIAELENRHISPGVIGIVIIRNDKTRPSWVCDELLAKVKDGVVVVGGNTLEYDNLLTSLRLDNENTLNKIAQLDEKLKELSDHYDEVFAGYKLI